MAFIIQPNRKKQKGVTLVEYALILALIAVAVILPLTDLGTNINKTLEAIAKSMTEGENGTPATNPPTSPPPGGCGLTC